MNIGMNLSGKTGPPGPLGPVIRNHTPRLPQSPTILEKLHQELKVPVGIIQRAFAVTPIEGWMP